MFMIGVFIVLGDAFGGCFPPSNPRRSTLLVLAHIAMVVIALAKPWIC
jgi:hypothetical protein